MRVLSLAQNPGRTSHVTLPLLPSDELEQFLNSDYDEMYGFVFAFLLAKVAGFSKSLLI